jgi:hypothetical protein
MLILVIQFRSLEPSMVFIRYTKLWRTASLLALNFNFFKRFWFLSVLKPFTIHFVFAFLIFEVFNCFALQTFKSFKFLCIVSRKTLIILAILEHSLSFLICQGFLFLQLHKDLFREITCLWGENSIILLSKYFFIILIKWWIVYFNDISICFSARWYCFPDWSALIRARNISTKHNMLRGTRFRSQRLSRRSFVRSVCHLCSSCVVLRLCFFTFNISFS